MLELLFKTSALFTNDCGAFDHILTIFMMYSFLKLLLLSSLVELIWPSHFFNKKNNFNLNYIKHRTFTEVLLKLVSKQSFSTTTNIFFTKYYLL